MDRMMPDLDKLSKDRRDWLEVFGNQWGVKHPQVEPLTAEEKQALADALNPWAKSPAPVFKVHPLFQGEMFSKEAFSLIWPRLE